MSNILHKAQTRPDVLVHMAGNVRRLRQSLAMSQQMLAERAGVSRRMLVNIEKGDVNVSLNTLDRIAEALDVFFHALVQPPDSEDSARIEEVAWAGRQAGSHATLLASKPAHQAVELWSWSLAPGERYDSPPDDAGWHEMLVVIAGRLTLSLENREVEIDEGDFHVFASNQPHAYINRTQTLLRFVRNVVY